MLLEQAEGGKNVQVHVEVLWTGNKDCSDAYRREPPGFWVMPPCVGFDNVPGHAFVRATGNSVVVTDIGDYGDRLVRVQMAVRKQKILPPLGSLGGSFAGITFLGGELYLFVMKARRDYLLIMDIEGNVLRRHEICDRQRRPCRIFGKNVGINGPVYPFRVVTRLSRSLLILESDIWHHLCEYTLTGVLKREWEGVTGCAVSQEGQVYASGRPYPTAGLTILKPPRELGDDSWHLLGIDNRRRLYWRSFIKRSLSIKLSSTGKVWTKSWKFNRLACSTLEGRLLWQIELDGPQGVLAHYDPYLHASGGAGGGWIEIEPSGSVLAFCVSRSGKVVGGVGFYRVNVE